MRPILALNCLLQIAQERSEEESSVGDALALAFCCAHFCLASLILFASYLLAPLLMRLQHFVWSCAICSDDSVGMLKSLREALMVSLYRFFWPPWERFPICSSPLRIFFGKLSSGILVTLPVHLNCASFRRVHAKGVSSVILKRSAKFGCSILCTGKQPYRTKLPVCRSTTTASSVSSGFLCDLHMCAGCEYMLLIKMSCTGEAHSQPHSLILT